MSFHGNGDILVAKESQYASIILQIRAYTACSAFDTSPDLWQGSTNQSLESFRETVQQLYTFLGLSGIFYKASEFVLCCICQISELKIDYST